MDSHDLHAFVAFAETRSFTHGATRVHLSQPALFAVVKRLGDAVGAPLYGKSGRSLVLTRAGAALLAHARSVLEAEQSLLAEVRGDGGGAAVLACGEGALVHVIAERVGAFCRAHPGRLAVRVADGPTALSQLEAGEIHVAVVASTDAGSLAPSLSAHDIRESRVVAVGLQSRLGGDTHASIGTRELAELPLILPAVDRPLRIAVEALFAARRAGAPRVCVEAGGWEALLALARLDVGVALVNDVVPVAPPLVSRPVRGLRPVVYRAVTRQNPGTWARALLDALRHGTAATHRPSP